MNNPLSFWQKQKTAFGLLLLNTVLLAFYSFGLLSGFDVYEYSLVGAMYKFVSIPFLAALVAMPVLLIIAWINGFKRNRWMLLSSFVLWIMILFLLAQNTMLD